jgi:hypothetical protein
MGNNEQGEASRLFADKLKPVVPVVRPHLC